MINEDDFVRVVRELSNGAWFFGSLFFWLACAFYLYRGEGRLWPVVIVRRSLSGALLPSQEIAISFMVFMTGSVLRSGYIWALLGTQNYPAVWIADVVQSAFIVMLVADAFMIVGSICGVRVMTPRNWRPWNWVVPGVIAFAVPALTWFVL